MGQPGMAEKWRNPVTTAAFAGLIWARTTVVRHETWSARSPSGGAPPWPARVARGWPETSPTAKTRFS